MTAPRRRTAAVTLPLAAAAALACAAWVAGVRGPAGLRAGDDPTGSADPTRVAAFTPDLPQRSNPGPHGTPAGLPRPSAVSVDAFDSELFLFLNEREYVTRGWKVDKGVRDTGPFVEGTYYGTHPAVRVWYSPETIEWLGNGRRGPLPDGAMFIKEQYQPPAERHAGKSEEELWESLQSWTVMVKDSRGSHDGWYWSNPVKGQCVVDNKGGPDGDLPFEHPVGGFGHYCLRCHASTRSPGEDGERVDGPANEFTFAALRNIAGYPGEPLRFRVDDSWREDCVGGEPSEDVSAENEAKLAPSDDPEFDADDSHGSHPACTRPEPIEREERHANEPFFALFDTVERADVGDVARIPPVTHDWAVSPNDPANGGGFVTSNQCMGCHAGLTAPFGPSMFVATGDGDGANEYGADGHHVSPYGEWRWTPMGLAGRDPIFHAQLASELVRLRAEFGDDPDHAEELCATLENTCLRCHGAMGHHQHAADRPGQSSQGKGLRLADVHATATGDEHIGAGDAHWGALARDGVSCAVCHRMTPGDQPAGDPRTDLRYYLDTHTTGNATFGPPNEIYGPLKDDEIKPYAMHHALGMKPKYNEYLSSSRMCGTCHTVSLPSVDMPLHDPSEDPLAEADAVVMFRSFHHHVEQATYLEWLNSEFQDEFDPDAATAQSCVECHMSRGLQDEEHGIDLADVATRIAAIQDATYPDAENMASVEDLTIEVRREGYRRHDFSGLNLFLLELFRQFDDVLGVRTTDFMTGSQRDLPDAIAGMEATARRETATLAVDAGVETRGGEQLLTADVRVTNETGHRFPTGVGFRRAFLTLQVVHPGGHPLVTDHTRDEVLWSSGRANELGVLVDEGGEPLPSEFFTIDPATGLAARQPHHAVITSSDQVQIYESLLCDNDGTFTTSFVHGCVTKKDNRLLPRGWTKKGPHPSLDGRYLRATHPGEDAAKDPRYADGSGSDEVRYEIPLSALNLPPGVDAGDLEVRVTLNYQAIPPYFLRNLFTTAPDTPEVKRLHSLLGHVDLKDTAAEGWKLEVARAVGRVK